MRTFALAVAALASGMLCSGLSEAKTTHHARPAARAAARPITGDQASAVAALAKAGLSIQADLNGVIASMSEDLTDRRRGAGEGGVLCFQVLEAATVELTGDLKELLVAATTASLARDPSDLHTSMRFTRVALEDVGDSVALVRKVTGARPPACRSNSLYREQASKLQTLANSVTSVTDDLSDAAGAQ